MLLMGCKEDKSKQKRKDNIFVFIFSKDIFIIHANQQLNNQF